MRCLTLVTGGVVVVVLAGCGSSIPTQNQVRVTTPSYDSRFEMAEEDVEHLRQLHEIVGGYAQRFGPEVACMHDPVRIFCVDKTGEVVRLFERPDGQEIGPRLASGYGSFFNGVPVYQPKDDGRLFYGGRDNEKFHYWLVYDPKARDLAGYLTKNGFKNVQVVNPQVAIADPIEDKQQRRDFWIWVQGREYQIKKFEAKYPHLAATVAPKE